ncbi:UDP-N-acetylmuramoyl-L-alanyl-D-glutamate--2,6-diaminopimelate ligase [Polymorphum gilvum]|uniref:UDP-N-acetylmuramoyl-L-alanyl-D-glutamate--2,6-diaminopimelate ligase n=1 Tax=Polymorphum gilvum (strain LMG 25793 / CGMCC 1.9160 / SL003B-26A1) TaxID=991905 RepID=F2J1I8_POLGS|nr:UDP-N-acetylmuramoyl-L-alanyl-D-glutamate--2,6-diaminopimelate ligase [Polymorphum gilvum]ADZ69770.1 putative UDP-n-acetylmuramoylalanyl-d-glutamate--2, 6-diaminopimelate ligase, putative-like protein [Polymorphum gilvum SL003B-26A1]
MHLDSLAADLGLPHPPPTLSVSGLTADSRQVRPGFLFAALQGTAVDGWRFVPRALEQGAVAVLTDAQGAAALAGTMPDSVPVLVAQDARRALALMAARFYGRQPNTMVAVTGTSGKTSVAHFVRQIFEHAGHASASLGTIGTVTSRGRAYGGLTTPDPVSLHAELARLADEGITHAALEASSHGLEQHRLDGVRLVAGAFTNLGRDHMDYHATEEDYLQAKLRLFRDLLPAGGSVVVDPGERCADRVLAVARERGLHIFTVGERGADLRLTGLRHSGFSQELTVETPRGDYKISLPLAGRFQVSNALIAAGLAITAGEATGAVLRALEDLEGAPGRLELVGRKANGALVFVDYAHKPDALENALAALRPFTCGRLFVVIGAGGDRDPGKRPLMGAAAARHADVVIVTDDNPRSEDPAAIRKAVLAGAPDALEIGDRGAAIAEAVARLEAGDVLCVAGKGHETGQIVGDTVLPFSDHDAVRAALDTGDKA